MEDFSHHDDPFSRGRTGASGATLSLEDFYCITVPPFDSSTKHPATKIGGDSKFFLQL
jgi:hypothetical protein